MAESLRQRALRLLAQRDHARVELKKKLVRHASSEEDLELIETLLDEFIARHLLSDARYAEMRVNSRSGRYGNARLAQELKQQGISSEDVDEALTGAGDELTRAHAIWARKFDTLPIDAADRARQTRFLMSRGFSGGTLRRLFRGEGFESNDD